MTEIDANDAALSSGGVQEVRKSQCGSYGKARIVASDGLYLVMLVSKVARSRYFMLYIYEVRCLIVRQMSQ